MIRKECISILAACLLGISSLPAFAAAPVIPQMPDRIIRAENAKEGLNAPSSEKDLVLLTWAENPESVRYEVEIFRGIPYNLDRNEPLADHVYDNQRIYTNKVIIDLSKIPAGDGVLYWRVRPIDADWTGLAPFSAPMEVRSTMKRLGRDAPLPNVYRPENGSSLIYPVYSYAGIPGAAKYEVEVTDSYPETLSGTAPSAHRVFSRVTSLSNVYDSDPRIGTYYWRVRGMDETGAPVGEWSLPERVRNDVESRYNVGIFGDSWKWNVPATQKFTEVIGLSVIMGGISFVLSLVIAVPLGVLAATKQYSRADYVITSVALVGISLPTFFFATLLKLFFSVKLGWFDLYGLVGRDYAQLDSMGQFLDKANHLVLPIVTLVIVSIGGYMRYTRTNMLEVLNADYIRTARAKGLSERTVIYKHAFRNTLIPLVTIIGGSLPGLFSGALITETLFSIPGIGYISYQSMVAGDIPFTMFYLSFMAVLTLASNLLTDILYGVVDPRVRIS